MRLNIKKLDIRKWLNATQKDIGKLLRKDRSYVAHAESSLSDFGQNVSAELFPFLLLMARKEEEKVTTDVLPVLMAKQKEEDLEMLRRTVKNWQYRVIRCQRALNALKKRQTASAYAMENATWFLSHPHQFTPIQLSWIEEMKMVAKRNLYKVRVFNVMELEIKLAAAEAGLAKAQSCLDGFETQGN